MYIQCAYKNASRNHDIESYAVAKIRSRIEKLVAKPVGIHVKFEGAPGRETTNCRIIAGDGRSVRARHSAGTFYQAIDGLVDKIAKQLRRKKSKARGRKAGGAGWTHLSATRHGSEPLIETFDSDEWDDWFYEGASVH